MNRGIKNIIDQLTVKPKTLFLIDSLGAFVTTFFLFVVLRNYNQYIGMPATILVYLSIIAACFCIYSTACFLFLKQHWTPFIRGISIANLVYCILTITLLIINYPLLTMIGITYFLLEIAILFGLIYIELNVATAIQKGQKKNS